MLKCIRFILNLLEKPLITIRTFRKRLVLLQLSAIISERVQLYQDLNKDIQHISNKDPTQKLNVVNKVLETKEDSEYHPTKKYSCLHKQLQVETIAHLLIPLRQYEGKTHNKYSYTTRCYTYSSKPTSYFITNRFNH